MWQKRYEKVFPGATKASIWAAWADVDNWHRWDEDIEFAKLRDPEFKEGARFSLKPKGAPQVKVRVTVADPARGFTDVTAFPLARMFDVHEMEDTAEGLKIVSVIRVEGPLGFLWRKLVAEAIADGVPKQLDALVKVAQGKAR